MFVVIGGVSISLTRYSSVFVLVMFRFIDISVRYRNIESYRINVIFTLYRRAQFLFLRFNFTVRDINAGNKEVNYELTNGVKIDYAFNLNTKRFDMFRSLQLVCSICHRTIIPDTVTALRRGKQ